MAVTLTLIRKTPEQTQFGLDRFTESYKCDATADVVLTDPGVPQMGAAHPDYPFMFVTNRYCTETSESASALDLVYMGCLTGEGTPNVPIGQSQSTQSPQTATNQSAPIDVNAPVTMLFYANTNTLTWVSTSPGTLGPSGDVSTPPDPVVVSFTYTLASIPTGFSGDIYVFFTNFVFVVQTTETLNSTEIVAGQYWQNVKTKNKIYIPLIII